MTPVFHCLAHPTLRKPSIREISAISFQP